MAFWLTAPTVVTFKQPSGNKLVASPVEKSQTTSGFLAAHLCCACALLIDTFTLHGKVDQGDKRTESVDQTRTQTPFSQKLSQPPTLSTLLGKSQL